MNIEKNRCLAFCVYRIIRKVQKEMTRKTKREKPGKGR
jgi:hypothetical protein